MRKLLLLFFVLCTGFVFGQFPTFDGVDLRQYVKTRKYMFFVPNASPPAGVKMGAVYFDTDTTLYYFNGVAWLPVGGTDYFHLRGTSTDTITASYNILQDSSFLMKHGNWYAGYWDNGYGNDPLDDNFDTTIILGFSDGTEAAMMYVGNGDNYGRSIHARVADDAGNSSFDLIPGNISMSTDSSITITTVDKIGMSADTTVLSGENIYMPDITATGKKFEYLVGMSPDGRLFPQPLASGYDSMMYYQSITPTAYSTWKRNAVSEQLDVANPTDKIKEIQTKERSWNGGLVTFSFDDGSATDYTVMRPLFNAKGVAATTNIVTQWVGGASRVTWSQLDSLAADGWEIGSHSMYHKFATLPTYDSMLYVAKTSRDTLIARGFDVSIMAYPGNAYSDSAMMAARQYYRAAMAGYSSGDTLNHDVLKTFALKSYAADTPADSATYYQLIRNADSRNQWLIFYIHATDRADSVLIANMIDTIQARGMSIVTTSEALDLIGNQLDISDGFAVNNWDMKIRGTIYRGLGTNHDKTPWIHTYSHTSSDGANQFLGLYAGNMTLSPAGGASYLASTNTGLGYESLNDLTTGYGNTGTGYLSLRKVTSGYRNTAVGRSTLIYLTTGYQNTAVGYMAATTSTGNNGTYIGYNSGYYQTGNANTLIGAESGVGATGTSTASNLTAVGCESLKANTTGANNTGIGYQALYANTTGASNTAIGNSALRNNNATGNTGIGTNSGYYFTGGANVFTGTSCGFGSAGNSTGTYNAFYGYETGYSNRGGSFNNAFGSRALYANQAGSSNNAIGYRAGYNETGSYKTYIAHDSTSWSNGMATASKLMWYSDASNADKANHFINLFGKVAIGEAKALSAYSLEVVGNANITTSCTLGTFLQLTPTADPPGSPSEGMIYADTDHHIYYYNGSTWVQLDN